MEQRTAERTCLAKIACCGLTLERNNVPKISIIINLQSLVFVLFPQNTRNLIIEVFRNEILAASQPANLAKRPFYF